MSVTVNAFPPLQSMNSSRGWALAVIVLLHSGFFWLLTAGLSDRIITVFTPKSSAIVNVVPPEIPRPPRTTPTEVEPLALRPIYVPIPDRPSVDQTPDESSLTGPTTAEIPSSEPVPAGSSSDPVLQLPTIDSRMPLTEPEYPPTEIRLGHAGTVVLSVYVLENGRIGDVRIEQSSGYPRLDLAAQRAARRWRLTPGTQDGRPTAMWKAIPITFQLTK